MSLISWDTMLFVYWLENHPENAPKVQRIFEKMERREDSLCTSIFTLAETLVGPYRKHENAKAEAIRNFFGPPNVTLLPFTENAADRFARIRADHRVSPADAIHLSCAAEAGVDLFITNDTRLQHLVIPGIHFITGMDTAPL